MEICISTYDNFRLKQIPNNILCIGVSKEIPDDFRTTSIHNFLYTPNNFLGGSCPDEVNPDDFVDMYIKHIKQKVKQLGYGTLKMYFQQMFAFFEKCEWKGICFLDNSIFRWYDVGKILKRILQEEGYKVKDNCQTSNTENGVRLF